MAMVSAARARQWQRVHELYSRFAALSCSSSNPEWRSVRKFCASRLVHVGARQASGATITPSIAAQLERLFARTLPGVDITRPISVEDDVVSRR